jgi:hypothetical protein
MQKIRIGQWLIALSLSFLMVACGGQGKDELKPVLSLTGETQRTVTANSVIIEGQLSDNIRVASFTYSLNQGKAQDVMQSLKGKLFQFAIDGLNSGENSVVIVAADAKGNQSKLELKVTAGMTPNLAGVWGNQKTPYSYCGDTVDVPLTFYITQDTGKITGSLKMGFAGNLLEGAFEGTVTSAGSVKGVATFEQDQTGAFTLQLENDSLTGSLTFKDVPSCDGKTVEDFVMRVALKKGVDLPPPPADDALEPNDTKEQASVIDVNSSHDLIFTYLNPDWFTFTLDKSQKVTAKVTNSLNFTGGYLSVIVFDAQGNFLLSGNSPDNINTWTLRPGTYYLQLQMSIFGTPAVAYTLELSTESLPNDAYEPNDTVETARALTAHSFFIRVGVPNMTKIFLPLP